MYRCAITYSKFIYLCLVTVGVIIYIFDSPGLQEQKFSHDFLHVYGDMSHINVEERTEQRRRKRMLKWREEKAQRSASSQCMCISVILPTCT